MFETDSSPHEVIPFTLHDLRGEPVLTISARDLHRGLKVGSTWIRGRIKRWQYQEGADFVTERGAPVSQRGHGGGRRAIEYHLALDVAQHIALMKNNAHGYAYRQRLLEIERAYHYGQMNPVRSDSGSLLIALDDVCKWVARKEIEERLVAAVDQRLRHYTPDRGGTTH